jgi:hypothetical protein
MRTSMRRHCLSSRRGGLLSWPSASASALRAMLLSALVVSQLSSDSVQRMRSVFSGSTKVLQSSERPLLLEGWDKFAWRSHLIRSEAHSGNKPRSPYLQGPRSGSSPPL